MTRVLPVLAMALDSVVEVKLHDSVAPEANARSWKLVRDTSAAAKLPGKWKQMWAGHSWELGSVTLMRLTSCRVVDSVLLMVFLRALLAVAAPVSEVALALPGSHFLVWMALVQSSCLSMA